jgi:hypothetical protein
VASKTCSLKTFLPLHVVRIELSLYCIIREATGIELHPNNMNREEGFSPSKFWKPLIQILNDCRKAPGTNDYWSFSGTTAPCCLPFFTLFFHLSIPFVLPSAPYLQGSSFPSVLPIGSFLHYNPLHIFLSLGSVQGLSIGLHCNPPYPCPSYLAYICVNFLFTMHFNSENAGSTVL